MKNNGRLTESSIPGWVSMIFLFIRKPLNWERPFIIRQKLLQQDGLSGASWAQEGSMLAFSQG